MIKILEKKALRGANIYSYRPVVVMTIDLGKYNEVLTTELGDFVDKLVEMIPSLNDHRCSKGVEGGFIMRMREGTLLGHVIEHIALELQYIAYMDVGFGKTIETDTAGKYNVIFSYWVEDAGIFAGIEAVEIVNSILAGENYDLESTIYDLKDIRDDHYLGPSTASIVQEAEARGISVLRLDDYNLVQLGEGKYQKRIQAAMTSNTSLIGVETAGNKRLTKIMLEDAGIPIPKGTVVRKLSSAIEDANWLGYPVVIKPHDGHHGKGVTTDIQNDTELTEAFERAVEISDKVIVEKYLTGNDYRLLVVGGKFVAAAKRAPAKVVGDGEHNIAELIDIENQNPDRGFGHENVMTRLKVSSVTEHLLEKSGYTMDTVLKEDEIFYLELTANLSTGGSAEDVTDHVHKANRFMAERIARIIGLDIAGIDMMSPTIEKPIDKVGGAVIEVNAAPGLRMHLAPAKGTPRNVAADIVEMMFPEGAQHDIPIVAVTGTNGKTTTVRMVANMLKGVGYQVGMTTTDGIYLKDRLIAVGDMSGPYSAKVVLRDPMVDCAVLETARGGILREGLGYKMADVGVVLNVQPDHLGLKGINTVEDLARVKSVVAETVRRGGVTVLNADDEHCVRMAEFCRETLIYFSLRPSNPVIQRHIDNEHTAVVYDRGYITIITGESATPVARAVDMPITLDGKAMFNIQNALATAAVGYGMGLDIEKIRQGLVSFFPSPSQTPGRMNFFSVNDFEVMLDYAHNPPAYKNIIDLVSRLGHKRYIFVFDVVGDRRDEDLMEICQMIASKCHYAVVYEDKDLRGRAPGELMDFVENGLISSGFASDAVKKIADETEAIEYALSIADTNDLVCIMSGRVDQVIQQIYGFQEKEAV
ncbi:Cyanophycin synthetase [Desulfamplus magnetovallimortis]|uniref:Cyanophycin synthetase n=1 Tax=Desulfamplus magnetovallimortis TaxID=1246637 RepID=A0A1W1HGQ6_9BACT|nr:cyanophycin synthetase [Desulfamplus magnetovallimortis]SLM31568.1 Cyanophycin synthetase [Desulfamplus magnetovallimortis]